MFLKTFSAIVLIGQALAFPALRFHSDPVVEKFPDGAVEWTGILACGGIPDWKSAFLEFSLDFNLDGTSDHADTVALPPAPCPEGIFRVSRTLFPEKPGILKATLVSGVLSESHSVYYGQPDAFLRLGSICSSPSGGEPEWVEIRNASSLSIPLDKILLDGKNLTGTLEPGKNLLITGDSTALRPWRPTNPILEIGFWSYLRNTGDTVRLSFHYPDIHLTLDSILYGSAAGFGRESCGSAPAKDGVSSVGGGFAMTTDPRHWNPALGPLSIAVTGTPGSRVELRLYDLDGYEHCFARGGTVPVTISLEPSNCRIAPQAGTAILLLSVGNVRLRHAILIGGP